MARLVQRSDTLPQSFYLRLTDPQDRVRIGRGGFARVYKTKWDGQNVAIKVPSALESVPPDPKLRRVSH